MIAVIGGSHVLLLLLEEDHDERGTNGRVLGSTLQHRSSKTNDLVVSFFNFIFGTPARAKYENSTNDRRNKPVGIGRSILAGVSVPARGARIRTLAPHKILIPTKTPFSHNQQK
jgi:hypothetical protein